MFSINIYLRFALIALCLIGGTYLAFEFGFWYAFPFLLAGLFLVVGYVLLGTVQSAALFMQNTDFDGVDKRLKLTLSPKLLYSTNRAYYYMMKGSIAQYRQNIEEAEMWLQKAEKIDVPTDNEKAMVQLQLANIAATKQKWNQAKIYFRNAKACKVTDANVKEQIRQFEKALTNRGQIKAAQMGGKQTQGGKRRRPKIR